MNGYRHCVDVYSRRFLFLFLLWREMENNNHNTFHLTPLSPGLNEMKKKRRNVEIAFQNSIFSWIKKKKVVTSPIVCRRPTRTWAAAGANYARQRRHGEKPMESPRRRHRHCGSIRQGTGDLKTTKTNNQLMCVCGELQLLRRITLLGS